MPFADCSVNSLFDKLGWPANAAAVAAAHAAYKGLVAVEQTTSHYIFPFNRKVFYLPTDWRSHVEPALH